jgi:dihydroorotate dehydrogenase (NAD+) catalytic subunit
MSEVDLSIKIGNLNFKSPVLLASGTVGYGYEIANFVDFEKLGGIVTKSVSLKPRKGNRPQRIVETTAGMLNAIGLANVGIDDFINDKIPFLETLNTNVICNVAAGTVDEYCECVKILDEQKVIKAFEINISCPNVKEGGLIFGNDINYASIITDRVRSVTKKPIILKLSPNTANIAEFARAAKENGADAVSAINTLVGAAFDIYSKKPKLTNITGGLSGPAIKPVAIAKVFEISRKVNIPIIGIGGICDYKDVVEFMIAGATAIQLGTINFVNPYASNEIYDNLIKFCNNQSINKISSLTASYII